MKRIIALILFALTLFTLTGCKNKCANCGEEKADNNYEGNFYCDSCIGLAKYAGEVTKQ